MVKLGCNADGILNEAKFSEPLPWIGIYIAVASLACAVVMAKDLIHGFRCGKFWFPNKFFCINATSLTVLTVAIKLSVDLNTPMPRRIDQLSKLSSSALICTVMGNSMPSLGTMQNNDLWMNLIALAILVITVVVNICIQLGTGVIYLFWKEHAVIMFLMICLLLKLIFSAFTVPTTKKYLEFKYKHKYEMALKECAHEKAEMEEEKKLRHNLMMFWMMAHTCSPQFVMGRSTTCTAAGALCLISASTLAEAMLRSYLMPWDFGFCKGESDYKWSTELVLVTQTVAIAVGTIAPAIRWFTAVHFRCPLREKNRYKGTFKVECYWTQFLVEMKECPFKLRMRSRRGRKLMHYVKNQLLDFCIWIQIGIVVGSKLIGLLSIYFVGGILIFGDFCKKLVKSSTVSTEPGPDSQSGSKMDLSRFVLHLEGENELVDLMMRKNSDATDHWIQKGKKKQPRKLIQLLEKSSKGLQGVIEFDSDLIHSLDAEEPPNSWPLPIVTLTAIAIAVPNISNLQRKQLVKSVHEGLIYVKHIEDNLINEGEMSNNRKAAYVVWQGIDLFHKWLDIDLGKLSSQAESTKEVLEGLAEAAKSRYLESKKMNWNHCLKERPSNWPVRVLAANSMYRISRSVMEKLERCDAGRSEMAFEVVSAMIADILGACLWNLKHIISVKCLNSSVEVREESVRHAAFLLGETESILKILNQNALPKMSPGEAVCIDEWRAFYRLKGNLAWNPDLEESIESPGPRDLQLVIV